MEHPLVEQLRFARKEFRRGIRGVTEDEAKRRFGPMNCIAWNVGHLAWQEQRYWIYFVKGDLLKPAIDEEFRYGAPGSTPSLKQMLADWKKITSTADPWLDKVTNKILESSIVMDGKDTGYTWGSRLLRMIYHYWYHTGENAAIRQNLGHTNLPSFIGNIDQQAGYRSR